MPKKAASSKKKKNRSGTPAKPKKEYVVRHREAAPIEDTSPMANDSLEPSGLIPMDVADGRPFEVRWVRQSQETYAYYQQRVLYDCLLAQRLGARDLCNTIAVAVERGDYQKLRVMRNAGIKLGFAMTALNDFGCSSVNFAVVTQNKPMLAFMHECGADLSMACLGPPNQEEYLTPFILARVQGWDSIAVLIGDMMGSRPGPQECFVAVQQAMIQDRAGAAVDPAELVGPGEGIPPGAMSAADVTVALGWRPDPHQPPASLRFAASVNDAPAIPIIPIDHETGERTHEDGTPLTRPSFLPPSGAPIARLEDSELPDGVTTESVVPKPPDPDSLVAELVKCQAAERILADMPSFEDVLEDERRQVTD